MSLTLPGVRIVSFGYVSYSSRRLRNDLPAVCVNCGGGTHKGDCRGPASVTAVVDPTQHHL